jgi:hypothetical protein
MTPLPHCLVMGGGNAYMLFHVSYLPSAVCFLFSFSAVCLPLSAVCLSVMSPSDSPPSGGEWQH